MLFFSSHYEVLNEIYIPCQSTSGSKAKLLRRYSGGQKWHNKNWSPEDTGYFLNLTSKINSKILEKI